MGVIGHYKANIRAYYDYYVSSFLLVYLSCFVKQPCFGYYTLLQTTSAFRVWWLTYHLKKCYLGAIINLFVYVYLLSLQPDYVLI